MAGLLARARKYHFLSFKVDNWIITHYYQKISSGNFTYCTPARNSFAYYASACPYFHGDSTPPVADQMAWPGRPGISAAVLHPERHDG
jgi:hypothetical protein